MLVGYPRNVGFSSPCILGHFLEVFVVGTFLYFHVFWYRGELSYYRVCVAKL